MDDKLDKLEATSETSSEIASSWNTGHEELLASIADRSNCYRWLHEKSQNRFDEYNFYLTIPSIVVSGLAGSATIGLTGLVPEEFQRVASVVIGIFTLGCGVMTSLNQYMKTSQFSEAHRSAAIAHGKLHRVISSELALRRDQRVNAMDFIKMVRPEQDRLQETSPSIPESVIRHFKRHFIDNTTVEKPEIIGDLDHVGVNKSMKNEEYTVAVPKTPSYPISPPSYSISPGLVRSPPRSPKHDHYSQSTQADQE